MSLFLRPQLWWGKERFGSLVLSVVRVIEAPVVKGPYESSDLEALLRLLELGCAPRSDGIATTYIPDSSWVT